jgi:hypothetical protein
VGPVQVESSGTHSFERATGFKPKPLPSEYHILVSKYAFQIRIQPAPLHLGEWSASAEWDFDVSTTLTPVGLCTLNQVDP